jgi:exonuclease VII small subunit
MNKLNFNYIFKNAFDTFKVFDTIPPEISGVVIEGHSKTIWQTLNHLIIWREFQIQKLTKANAEIDFDESESWISELKPNNPNEWNKKISMFKSQAERIENLIKNLDTSDLQLEEKLKLIQDSSTHLSFHLGEIIVIARQKNKYPKPSEMSEFLKE